MEANVLIHTATGQIHIITAEQFSLLVEAAAHAADQNMYDSEKDMQELDEALSECREVEKRID